MSSEYNVVTNNCQEFCQRFANCILIPESGRDILYRSNELPTRSHDWVLCRRFWDYFLAQEDGRACSVQSFPFSVHGLSSLVIDGLTTSILFINWNRAEKTRFSILVLTLWLCGWCGDIGVFRHLPRRIATEHSSINRLKRVAYPEKLEHSAFVELNLRGGS